MVREEICPCRPPQYSRISPSRAPILERSPLLTSPYFPLTLQSSTNLINWTSLATNNPVTSLSIFTNPVPTGVNRRFYRAFLTPYP